MTSFCGQHNLEEIKDKYGDEGLRIVHMYGMKYIKAKKRSDKVCEIIDELKSGMSQADIARKHNVSRQYVFIIKKAENL